jgi:hypothetical protein
MNIIRPHKYVLSIIVKSVSRKKPRRFSPCSSVASAEIETTPLTEPSHFSEIDRTVRFAPTAGVRRCLSRTEYTPEEIKATWYQDEEYRTIRKDCCKQINKMQNGEVLKDKKYCSRGLESHTRLAAISKTQNRKTANNAALDEQEEQQRMGVVDEQAIAQRYQQTTSSMQLWATAIGFRDQRVAEEYMD